MFIGVHRLQLCFSRYKQWNTLFLKLLLQANQPKKNQAVVNFPRLPIVWHPQSFLEFIYYYSRFLPTLSITSSPWTLSRSGETMAVDKTVWISFQTVKKVISNILLTRCTPVKMVCDASKCGISTINGITHYEGQQWIPNNLCITVLLCCNEELCTNKHSVLALGELNISISTYREGIDPHHLLISL